MTQIRLLFVGLLLFCVGCKPSGRGTPSPTTVIRSTPARSDVAGLQRLIILPRKPVAVVWTHTQIGDGNLGPSDAQLLAVIQYAPADADKIEQSARKQGGSRQGETEALPWFPSALRQKAMRSAEKMPVIRGDKLNASSFAHLSLNNGFIMRVPNSPYIIVSLFTN